MKNLLQQEPLELAAHGAVVKQEIKHEPDAPVAVKKEKETKTICTVDLKKMTCKRLKDGKEVALTAGPNNVMVADFGNEMHTTELSNLMLLTAKPKKSDAKTDVSKKPAGAEPPMMVAPVEPAADPPDPAAPVPAEERDDYYPPMWYKNSHQIGIKAKFGAKQQVLSFGGMACTKTKKQMQDIGKEIIKDLNGGMSYKDAKAKGNRLAFE